MLVSVIIPVYSAEEYVRQAVESALLQPETGEVILIEDGSPDNSLQVCRTLSQEYAKVKLLRHVDGKNLGAGASRNLGIQQAKYHYISFLDADDYFLPDRFSTAKSLFEKNPDAEGVYEAVGVHFEDGVGKDRWKSTRGNEILTTMNQRVHPENLFETQMPMGGGGYCPTGGWVVKRSIFDKTGLFDEHLRVHQDTVMYAKFAAVGNMLPGRLGRPVAMRRVHSDNRVLFISSAQKKYKNRILMWVALWQWGKYNLSKSRQTLVVERFIHFAARPYERGASSEFIRVLSSTYQLIVLLAQYPSLAGEAFFWKRFLINFLPPRGVKVLKRVFGV